MTRFDFFDAMNGIDPALIERADKVTIKKKNNFAKIAAIAAAIAVMAGLVAAVLPSMIRSWDFIDKPPQTVPETMGDNIVWSNIFAPQSGNESGETAFVKSSFAEMMNEEYANYIKGIVIDGSAIGEKLAQTDIRTGWRWYDGSEDEIVVSKAEIFAINNVDPSIAVAVKYLDGEKPTADSTGYYYVARNGEYHFESLGKFYEDCNISENIELAEKAYLYAGRSFYFSGTSTYRLGEDVAGAIIDRLLALDAAAVNTGWLETVDEDILNGSTKFVRLQLMIETLGVNSSFLYVLDTGYIALQISGFNEFVLFNVGRESTDALLDAVTEQGQVIYSPGWENEGLSEATTATVAG